MTTAIFIGRFQPLHVGHMRTIRLILGKVDRLVLGIGSSQYSNTLENPFNVEERRKMIELVLADALDRLDVVGVEDIHNEPRWVEHVVGSVPPFDVVYTSSPIEKRLFKEAGYSVVDIPFYKREIYSATKVREKMGLSDEWRELVPDGTITVIEEVGGIQKLRRLKGLN